MDRRTDAQRDISPQEEVPLTETVDEYAERFRRTRSRKWLWLVLLLLVLVPIVYFTVQVFIIMMPRMKTEVVLKDTMTDSVQAEGFVVMQSVPVYAGDGALYYTVPLGQRVSTGAEVAKVFADENGVSALMAIERLDEEIRMLEDAQNTRVEGGEVDVYLKQMQEGMYDLLDVIESGKYAEIDTAAGEVTLAANRLQVVTGEADGFADRMQQLLELRGQLEFAAVESSVVTAPETGFFVPSEKHDVVFQDSEVLEACSPLALQEALAAEPVYYGEDIAGHIVQNYKWSYFMVIPADQMDKFRLHAKLELAFPDVSDETVPVLVEDIVLDEENQLAKIQLACENMSPTMMTLRNERAEIIFRTEKGIRIDKDALRVIEGERCVYVKFGNQVFKRNIQVLLEDENYLLIPEEYEAGVNEVQLYDEVIVDSGGEELYDKKIL